MRDTCMKAGSGYFACSEIMSPWHAVFRVSTEASAHLRNALFRGVLFQRHGGRGVLPRMPLSCWKVATRGGVCQADRMSLSVSEAILWRRTSRQNWLQLLVCLPLCLSVCLSRSLSFITIYLRTQAVKKSQVIQIKSNF